MIKKIIISSIIVLCFCNKSLFAQIGINTETPLGIFHIDGAGDTSSSGQNITDDIILSADGQLGIGAMPTSKAKVKIEGAEPFKLSDGSQAVGKVLSATDANGNLKWVTPPISWAQIYNLTASKSAKNASSIELFRTTVPYTGKYLVTLRWWGKTSGLTASLGTIISAYFNLQEIVGTTLTGRDGIEYYIPFWASGTIVSFTVFLIGDFTAGNQLVLGMTPASPMNKTYYWTYGGNSDNLLNPSVVLFKI